MDLRFVKARFPQATTAFRVRVGAGCRPALFNDSASSHAPSGGRGLLTASILSIFKADDRLFHLKPAAEYHRLTRSLRDYHGSRVNCRLHPSRLPNRFCHIPGCLREFRCLRNESVSI